MVTKKASKKSASKKGGGARGYAVDRNQSIDAMVKDLQRSKDRSSAFMSDPAQVAKEYGIKLTPEEQYAIKFVSGLSIASTVSRLSRVMAFFDNNCGCGGGGTASW